MLNALVKMLRFPIEKQWLIGMFCLLRALEKTKTAFFFFSSSYTTKNSSELIPVN